jgi:predicted nucleic acid-binding protein
MPASGSRRLLDTNIIVALLEGDETVLRNLDQGHQLRAKGRPLPENDIWIGAIARHHMLALVTGDRHFREIDNLVPEAW